MNRWNVGWLSTPRPARSSPSVGWSHERSAFAGYPLTGNLWNFILENKTSEIQSIEAARDKRVEVAIQAIVDRLGDPRVVENLEELTP